MNGRVSNVRNSVYRGDNMNANQRKADADRLCDEGLAIFRACLMESSNVGEGDGSLLPRRREYVGDILIGCASWCDSDVDLEEEQQKGCKSKI
jgi:hypothetical protein